MTKDLIVTEEGQKVEMDSYTEDPRAVYGEKKETSFHDDADPGSGTAEVGKGLQRNLQARHLTMISLGKPPYPLCDRPNLYTTSLPTLFFFLVSRT
jgi:hypothetical protein